MALSDTQTDGRREDAAPAQYPVNLRFTLPFYPNAFFVTLIIGREKRGPERLREERARHQIQTWGNLFTVAATWTVFSIATLFAVLVVTAL